MTECFADRLISIGFVVLALALLIYMRWEIYKQRREHGWIYLAHEGSPFRRRCVKCNKQQVRINNVWQDEV